MKRCLLFFAVLLLCGCGYHAGSIMHPQVKTIGIANIVNETTSYNISFQLQNLLAQEFMQDGSLKVVDRTKSDCIIYAKIMNVGFSEVAGTYSSTQTVLYAPSIWSVKVTVTFSVVIPGRAEPLIPQTTVVGETTFQGVGDLETIRQSATEQALRETAQKIVHQTTESW